MSRHYSVIVSLINALHAVLYWLRWSAITLLSIQPHQEPRFLTPLVTPMIVFVVNNGRILRAKKLFWVSHGLGIVRVPLLNKLSRASGSLPTSFSLPSSASCIRAA